MAFFGNLWKRRTIMARRWLSTLLALVMVLSLLGISAYADDESSGEPAAEQTQVDTPAAAAEPVETQEPSVEEVILVETESDLVDAEIPSDEEIPTLDALTMTLTGTFRQTEARSMLAMINSFRTGSDAWYWNSNNRTKTVYNTEGGTYLSELTYDYDLEQIAMQRAMELSTFYSHTRPNGQSCFTVTYNGTRSWAENIAKGQDSVSSAFLAWQETDYSYSGQGHRRAMLNEAYTAVGIACFSYNGRLYWVQEFGYRSSSSAETDAADNVVTGELDVLDHGTCGDSLTWTLNDGTLTVSGTGNMMNGSFCEDFPWPTALITDVIIEDGVTSIGDYAFSDTPLSSISISNSVTSIGDYAFSNTPLSSISIPNSVTSIGDYAFSNTPLSSISISNSVTSIGDYAFYDCDNLCSITIPESVAVIGDSAFGACSYLYAITILNPDCKIQGMDLGINYKTVIYGYAGSTAEDYARAFGYTFKTVVASHDHVFEEEEDAALSIPADCTAPGVAVYKCLTSGCGELRTEVGTELGTHWYNSGETLLEATETQEGQIKYTCYFCGDTYTEPIPMITHLLGDLDDSGKIDLKDVTALFQFVNGQTTNKFSGSVSDVNKDGTTDLKDVTRLFQFVNGQISAL
jgi:uncharacterized protein YkwD